MSTYSGSAAPRHPALDLLARYRAIFRAVWGLRHELSGPKRLTDETAFLPAALSLQETPVHPAPQRFAWVICGLFVVMLVWSIVGHIDIVAVAPGRIVVSERTKTLQPLETSVVRKVLVRDGDAVQARQVLVELDATNASADGANAQEQLAWAQSEELRTTVLMQALRSQRAPSIPAEATRQARAQLDAEWQDISAHLAKLDAEQARRQAELATVRETIGKLEATLPMARQREIDFKVLADKGFMSGHAGQDRTRDRIEQERDLATQQARLAEARAASRETTQARAAYLAETLRSLSERQAQAILKRQQFTQELNKTQQRSRLTQLTAPVDGTVQQVAVHTEGGVVTEAQVLMVIVPKDAQVTAEVVIDNKDIGFVNAGQAATIKLETFPYTRYGTVVAQVKSVTADAVTDEKKGAIFPATLTLEQAYIDVDGKRIALSPGMNLTAEIKTGRRRVIDYLLSPVQKAASESLRER